MSSSNYITLRKLCFFISKINQTVCSPHLLSWPLQLYCIYVNMLCFHHVPHVPLYGVEWKINWTETELSLFYELIIHRKISQTTLSFKIPIFHELNEKCTKCTLYVYNKKSNVLTWIQQYTLGYIDYSELRMHECGILILIIVTKHSF